MRQPAERARGAMLLAAALLLLASLTSCRPTPEHQTARAEVAVVVASFAFPESDLLAEIYAQALTDAGVPVRREPRLGPRELVLPALQQGFVDVVPEYLGTAVASAPLGGAQDRADGSDVPRLRHALNDVLRPWGLRALAPSPASDQNMLALNGSVARRLGVTSVSDLVGAAPELTFATTPECATRSYCLPGLRDVYGLQFGRVVTYPTESVRAAAIDEGSADVALLFSTNARLGADLVGLRDDRHLQPPDNVVPVVSRRALARYGAVLVPALDRVSAALTTEALRYLDWRTTVDGRSVRTEARAWLLRHGLVTARR